MLDQEPDEKLIGDKSQCVGDEKADGADMGLIARAMVAKAHPAVEDIADAREYQIDPGHRQHRVNMQEFGHRPIGRCHQHGQQ